MTKLAEEVINYRREIRDTLINLGQEINNDLTNKNLHDSNHLVRSTSVQQIRKTVGILKDYQMKLEAHLKALGSP